VRICLINPPSPFLINADIFSPLGLYYVGAELKKRGHEVAYIDQGIGDTISDGFDVYGVTGTTPQAPAMRQALADIHDMGHPVVVGGPHATLDWTDVQTWHPDSVYVGEGEEMGVETLLAAGGGDVKDLVIGGRLKDLNAVQHPDRTDELRYTFDIHGKRATTMMTSRGCPFTCAFCAGRTSDFAGFGREVHMRHAENVMEEIYQLKDLGFEAIMFYDDIFAMSRSRMKTLAPLMEATGMNFRGFLRANMMDEEMADLLMQAGFAEICFGIESGSEQILLNIEKRETVQQGYDAIRIAMAAGLRAKTFYIVGLPGESPETVKETAEFISNAKPTDVDFSILTVYAGTPIHDHPENYDVEFSEPTFYKGKPGEYNAHVSTSHMTSEEIVEARDWLEKEFKDWGVVMNQADKESLLSTQGAADRQEHIADIDRMLATG
jgi:anaerobic magnesium-protoporphyrin IX monomethyl ester cyclase